MLLSGKVAIITGGAHGMGRGIALKFADEGCDIAIADIIEDEANNTAVKVREKGREAFAIKCDQADIRHLRRSKTKSGSHSIRLGVRYG